MTLHEFNTWTERYLEFRFHGHSCQNMASVQRNCLRRFREHLFPTEDSVVDWESDETIFRLRRWIQKTFCLNNQFTAIRTMKWFSRWLYGSGLIRFDWCADLPSVRKPPAKRKSVITPEQFEALKAEAIGHWIYWPIVVGWYTGLSISDAAGLRWRDVDLRDCMIRKFRKKTDRLSTIPFEREGELHKMLERRLVLRRFTPGPRIDGEDDDPENDFVDRESARKLKGGILCDCGANKIFEKLKEKAGIHDRLMVVHSLRVSFVSRLANSGVNLAVAMAMTGHKSAKVFSTYVRPSEDAMRAGLSAAFGRPTP